MGYDASSSTYFIVMILYGVRHGWNRRSFRERRVYGSIARGGAGLYQDIVFNVYIETSRPNALDFRNCTS